MKKINTKNLNNEIWFNWLTRKLNSYEALNELDLGKNPKHIAENFISLNSPAISKIFKEFDEDDKNTLEQFQKLTECEWHVFRILKSKLLARNNVRFVDFRKGKK